MVTLDLIYGVMTNFYGCDFRKERIRSPEIADKKAMFAMVARHYGHRCCDIRDYMGWRHHSSVCHATKVMRGFVDVYPKVQKETVEILNSVDKAAGVGYLVFDSAV